MGKSNYFENEVLRLSLGKALQGTYPATIYMALFTTMPGEDGTGGVEVSGGGYARFANVGSKFPDPSGTGSVANSADISFGVASSSWGNVKGFALMTASSNGTLLRYGLLASAYDINAQQPVLIPAGAAVLAED
jgi:hypothetical protein